MDHRIATLLLPHVKDPATMTRMTAVERMSEPFTIVVDIEHRSMTALDLQPMLGHVVHIEFKTAAIEGVDPFSRHFDGILWEYVELGRTADEISYNYRLTLRPNLDIRTMERQSLIHYKKSISDLIGTFSRFNVTTMLNGTYPTVEYRVQYGESGFAFLSRQLEKEGIYYFYRHSATGHECVFVDMRNSHEAMSPATVWLKTHGEQPGNVAVLTSLVERRSFNATEYIVDDYDYTAPTTMLQKTKPKATFGAPPSRYTSGEVVNQGGLPRYVYPAGFDSATIESGATYAERWLDSDRREMARSFAEGNVFSAAVGRTVKIDYKDAGTKGATEEYLIVGTTHRYSNTAGGQDFHVELELMPAALQYRPARKTPIPRIYGPQTAVVIGPKGEEIYTDKYGRVKVSFFWDKTVPSDDTGSIWVRVGQSGAGSGFGSFMVPRIGHEVIVEFLDGDPDRPIITGAVYNGSNLPAFGSAADNTVQGIKTNSSKGGGGYNEIKIDDKKDSELFSLHAQKDLKWVVDKGDETRDLLEGSRTTVIHKGDETMTVTKGKRTTTIESDEATTIKTGSVTHTVEKGDVTRTIKTGKRTTEIMGDDKLTIKTGNREATLSMGNDNLTVSLGDVDIKVSLGNHKTEALQSIELKCGLSSFKMDPFQIEMKSMMVKIEGSIMLETKGLMVQQEGTAMHIVKGGIVMIN